MSNPDTIPEIQDEDVPQIISSNVDDPEDDDIEKIDEVIPKVPLNHRSDRKYDPRFEVHSIEHQWKDFREKYEAQGYTWYINPADPYGSLEDMMMRCTLKVKTGPYYPTLKEMRKFLQRRDRTIRDLFYPFANCELLEWIQWIQKNEAKFPPYRIISTITESTIPEYQGLTSTSEA